MFVTICMLLFNTVLQNYPTLSAVFDLLTLYEVSMISVFFKITIFNAFGCFGCRLCPVMSTHPLQLILYLSICSIAAASRLLNGLVRIVTHNVINNIDNNNIDNNNKDNNNIIYEPSMFEVWCSFIVPVQLA